jgi:AbrB family looped-hinge helix DNA binding protein
MNKAKITYKGQITLPKPIRDALILKEGDSVVFTLKDDHAILRPFQKKSLSDFYGAMPATRPYHGLEEVRKEFRQKMAKRHTRKGAE